MPRIFADEALALQQQIPGRPLPELAQDDVDAPGLLDVAAASFRQHNVVSSLYDRMTREQALPSPDLEYDPFADIKGYEAYADRFVRSQSGIETANIKSRIDQELSDRDVLRRAGVGGIVTSIAAGIIDPTTIASMAIPVAPAFVGATRAARVVGGVASQVAADSAIEGVLHANQELRTLGESAINVGAGALLTGVLGAWATRIPKAEFEFVRRDLGKAIEVTAPPAPVAKAAAADVAPAPTPPARLYFDARLGDQLTRERLAQMRFETGNVQEGGRVIREGGFDEREQFTSQGGEVVGRTSWIPRAEWWGDRPKGLTEAQIKTAIGKAVAGEKLGKRETEMVGYLLDVIDAERRVEPFAAQADELEIVGAADTLDNSMETGLVARAAEIDEAAVEKAALQYENDPDGFLRAIKEIAADERPAVDASVQARAEAPQESRPFQAETLDYDSTVGAAAVSNVAAVSATSGIKPIDLEGIAKGGRWIAALVKNTPIVRLLGSPMARLLQSPSMRARQLVQQLVNIPFALEKNFYGIRTPVSAEAKIELRIAQGRSQIANDLDTSFRKYRESGGTLSVRQFGEQVTISMRRGDIHDIPEVAQVAQRARKMLNEDLKQLQALKVLPEDIGVLGAESYLPRVYNQSAIAANRQDFENRIRRWFTQHPKLDENGVPRDLEPAEIETAVQETVERILGTYRGTADLGMTKPSALKARKLDVPDEILEPYLVRDFEKIMSGYFRSIAPQIEMRLHFDKLTIDDLIKNVEDDYAIMQNRARSDATKEKLRKQAEQDIADLKGLQDRLLGQVGETVGGSARQFVRAQRILRGYNYIRLLGAQTLSSIPDYGRIVSRYGLSRTASMTAKFLTSVKANRIIRADAKRAGTALEWALDSRSQTLGEIGDELAIGSGFEQGLHWAAQKFTRVSGMATWNSSLKAIAAALEQDAIIRALGKKSLNSIEVSKLAQLGIDETAMTNIARQLEKYGEDTEGLFRARTELWDDQEAAKLFESSIKRVSDMLVLTKGLGDLPFFMDKEVGKTLLQFKSFGMASVNRIMIPVAQGLAHGDAAAANGLAVMLGLGALSYYLKELAAGREADLSPGRVMAEASNWSGLFGFAPDIYDPAIASPFNLPRLSRYGSRSPLESAAGPTYGTMTDLIMTSRAITDGEMEQSDVTKLRRLMPLQNLFYIRRLVNAVEGEVGEAVGAEGATYKTFGERVTELEQPQNR